MTIHDAACSCAVGSKLGCAVSARVATVAHHGETRVRRLPATPPRRVRAVPRGAGRLRPRGAGARAVPTGPPPTCSGTSRGVQWFWATIDRAPGRRRRTTTTRRGPERPASYDGLLARVRRALPRALVAELDGADPAEPAWTWSSEQTVGFTFRRQAHEALIHRLDAEQTAGAGDAARPGAGRRRRRRVPRRHVRRRAAVGRVRAAPPLRARRHHRPGRVGLGADRPLHRHRPRRRAATTTRTSGWSPTPGVEPDAVVSGPAAALDAWLWRRGDDSEIHGDRRPRRLRPLPASR